MELPDSFQLFRIVKKYFNSITTYSLKLTVELSTHMQESEQKGKSVKPSTTSPFVQ